MARRVIVRFAVPTCAHTDTTRRCAFTCYKLEGSGDRVTVCKCGQVCARRLSTRQVDADVRRNAFRH